jgi:histone H3/H4
MIEKSEAFCRAKKRKTIMFSDIENTVAHDQRLIPIVYGTRMSTS